MCSSAERPGEERAIFEEAGYSIARGPLTLTLIRHGEVLWTQDGRTVSDPPLTVRGAMQARCIAENLTELTPDAILVSPMSRATDTASLAFPKADTFQTLDWLAEIGYPDWAGQPAENAARELATLRTLSVDERWTAFSEHAEDARNFVDRVRRGLLDWFATIRVTPAEPNLLLWETGDNPYHAVIVAHVGSINAIISQVLGLPAVPWEWDRFQLGCASLTQFVTVPVGTHHTFSVRHLSYVEHIPTDLRSW